MGTAICVNAKQVVIDRMDLENKAKVTHLDILWIMELLKIGKKKKIILNDYLVIALQDWCSYQDKVEEFLN